MIKNLLLISMLIFSAKSFAAFDNEIYLRGKLTKYDDQYFWLDVPAGRSFMKTVKFNIKSAPAPLKGFVAGVAEMTVHVPIAEFVALNPQAAK